MPTKETLMNFREGLKIIQQADDFATLRDTIDAMISICPPEDSPLAKDAIARVLRIKQARELNSVQAYPQAVEELDKKYRDIYIILRAAKSKAGMPRALPSGTSSKPASNNQMAKAPALGGLNMPKMLLGWLKSKKKYIMAGGAVGAVGGAFLLYKQLTADPKPEPGKEESNFDKTIKSIQKYKAFTSMMKNPDFSGDFTEIVNGNVSGKKPKKRKELKKDEPRKSMEWDREEKSLMKDMDDAFSSIATKPDLDYQLPQLPAPRNIDPKEVIGDDKPLELHSIVRQTNQNRVSSVEKTSVEKPKKPRKKRRKNTPKAEKSEVKTPTFPSATPVVEVSEATEPKTRKVKRTKPSNASPKVAETQIGRLIPIVKRTKRVKKVNA